MVDLGANQKATGNDGKTPYDLAVEEEEDEVAEYLKELTQSDWIPLQNCKWFKTFLLQNFLLIEFLNKSYKSFCKENQYP